MFAVDTKLYHINKCESDCDILQQDLKFGDHIKMIHKANRLLGLIKRSLALLQHH